MKIERHEDETDEDWAERLAYEIEIANNTETTQYFVERDSYNEDNIIINYCGKDRFTWKEHPEGPFSCKQILEWKHSHDAIKKLIPKPLKCDRCISFVGDPCPDDCDALIYKQLIELLGVEL